VDTVTTATGGVTTTTTAGVTVVAADAEATACTVARADAAVAVDGEVVAKRNKHDPLDADNNQMSQRGRTRKLEPPPPLFERRTISLSQMATTP
jgi:hypothetical protein